MDNYSHQIEKENTKRFLNREEKKLGKIADKNHKGMKYGGKGGMSMITGMKTKALRRHK